MTGHATPWLSAYAHVLDGLVTSGCVVTTHARGVNVGSFVTSVIGCNLRRPRVLVATWRGSLTHELIGDAGVLAVHILGPEHAALVDRFGRQSGRDVDKFEGLAWRRGETGVPVLLDCLGHVEGRVVRTMDCGDHVARLVEPVTARWNVAPRRRSLLTTDICGLRLEKPVAQDPERLT
jgi:flavin reductase (DIM6/NTAB) family NADH-FMN oxidoreductase RutF